MGKMKSRQSWVVRVEAKVIKEIICEGCTEEEARNNPFSHAAEETEIEQRDWEVIDVKPNT